MKVNKFGMLIKFAALYFCINLTVVLAIPLDETKSDVDVDYDATPTEATNVDTKPPLVFPFEDEKSTSKNETALEILQKNSNTSIVNNDEKSIEKNKTAEDYDDAEKAESDTNKTTESAPKKEQPKTEEITTKKANKEQPTSKDKEYDDESTEVDSKDAENIQENQDQGDLEERYGVNSTYINVFEEPTLTGRHIAFIFATSLLFLSATAYVGLIVWRKTLERRYGMRQRLVTEDDYYNNNDVRFFGL